jgi:hypothetical protein
MRSFAVVAGVLVCTWLFCARAAHAQDIVPIADAGPDVTLACVAPGGTPVNLSALGSSIGPDFDYFWSAPGVQFSDPTSPTPIGIFPVGVTVVTLVVTHTDPETGEETQAADTVVVTVSDTTAPLVHAVADPTLLWPPNHKLVPVHVDLVAFDTCDPDPDVELVWISSSEADNGTGDGNTANDIAEATTGTEDVDFLLRAERAGPGAGRVYSALYRATDESGNHADALVRVFVPHDRGHDELVDDGSGHGGDFAKAKRDAQKAAKLQMRAAKKSAKLAKKAYKAALRASR